MPNASIFDHFQIGDISIGNQGVAGEDLAAMFGNMAQAEAIQDAREREERRRRTQLTIISLSVVATILFILFLFYLFTRPPKPNP